MNEDFHIPEPILFNPFKHHIGFIKEFVNQNIEGLNVTALVKAIKHLGTSVMDIYKGSLTVENICKEILEFLKTEKFLSKDIYSLWTGKKPDDFRIIILSDNSQWTLKYHEDSLRFIHIFPARSSPHTFRVKANTLKSALIYIIIIGKDLVTGDDLNKVRPLIGLSPVKDPIDTEAILEMIEILRD